MINPATSPGAPRAAAMSDTENVLPLPPADNETAGDDFEQMLNQASGASTGRGKSAKLKAPPSKPANRAPQGNAMDLSANFLNWRQPDWNRPTEAPKSKPAPARAEVAAQSAESRSGSDKSIQETKAKQGVEQAPAGSAAAKEGESVAQVAAPTEAAPTAELKESVTAGETVSTELINLQATPADIAPETKLAPEIKLTPETKLAPETGHAVEAVAPDGLSEVPNAAAENVQAAKTAQSLPLPEVVSTPAADSLAGKISAPVLAQSLTKTGAAPMEKVAQKGQQTGEKLSGGMEAAPDGPDMILEASYTPDLTDGTLSDGGQWTSGRQAQSGDSSRGGNDFTRQRVQDLAGVSAAVQTVGAGFELAGEPMPVSALADPQAAVMMENIWSQVTTFRLQGQTQYVVQLQPDAQTQLQLTIQYGASGLEIQTRLQQGDLQRMTASWAELQTSLAERGVQLRPLEAGQATTNGFTQSQSQQGLAQHDSGEAFAQRRAEEDGLEMMGLSRPPAANRAASVASAATRRPATQGGWEGWA